MDEEIKQLQEQINDLQRQIGLLRSSTTIPLEIGEAMKVRVLTDTAFLTTSSKVANSENQAVNEAGAATYNVLKPADGFLQIILNGTTYYLPYYDTL